jgi:integrase
MTDPAPILTFAARPGAFPWVRLKALVLNGISSAHTRRAYEHAFDAFHAWYRPEEHGPFGRLVVQGYRAELETQKRAASTINLQLAALRRLAAEAVENGLIAPEVAVGIGKVRGVPQGDVRVANWLTRDQTEQLLRLPDVSRAKGRRDQALLALFVGCGLRRSELAALSIEHIQQRSGRWVIVDLIGKGLRVRSVPMPSWAKTAVDRWTESASITGGRVFRAINKADRLVSDRMTPQSIFEIVERYSRDLGVPVAPYDLRRTFAKLAHRGKAPIEQIQRSLGHASLQTTERYLGLEQDFVDAPCDRLGIQI